MGVFALSALGLTKVLNTLIIRMMMRQAYVKTISKELSATYNIAFLSNLLFCGVKVEHWLDSKLV